MLMSMEASGSGITSPRVRGSQESDLHSFELEELDSHNSSNHRLHSMNALEILRETVRVFRYDSLGFLAIAALLISPVSAVLLSNVLVEPSIVKRLSIRLLLIARSSGLPLRPLTKQSCQKFAEMVISSVTCFPFHITLLLLSKAAVVYSVDCTYSRKKLDASKFLAAIVKIWRRLLFTYLWVCIVIVGCIILFVFIIVAVCNFCSIVGFPSHVVMYAAVLVGLVFSVVFANVIIVCNISIVISILEDAMGIQALLRSCSLVRGQTQVGLLIFLGSTMGLAFVEGLFEHRVKILSYGDGSSRIWEGPLLVIMYSFVVLIDSMMSAVFYFSCRCSSKEVPDGDYNLDLESKPISSGSLGFR